MVLMVIFVVDVGFGGLVLRVEDVEVLDIESVVVAETLETTELTVPRSIFSGSWSRVGSVAGRGSKSE